MLLKAELDFGASCWGFCLKMGLLFFRWFMTSLMISKGELSSLEMKPVFSLLNGAVNDGYTICEFGMWSGCNLVVRWAAFDYFIIILMFWWQPSCLNFMAWEARHQENAELTNECEKHGRLVNWLTDCLPVVSLYADYWLPLHEFLKVANCSGFLCCSLWLVTWLSLLWLSSNGIMSAWFME